MRFLKDPKRRAAQPIINWIQERFNLMYRDIPASELPDGSLFNVYNMLLYGNWAEVRPGTRLWAEADIPTLAEDFVFSAGGAPISPLPDIPGRQHYYASKTGTIITKTSGMDFISTDLYKYFVWPDGIRDIIIEVLNYDQVRVKSDEEHADCTTGKIQGRINQRIWHDESRLLFFHIDKRVFYTDWKMSSFHEVMNVSGHSPADEKSSMDEYDGFIYLWTSNGIFKIDHKENVIQMVWINSSISEADYTALAKSSFNKIARRYVNTMSVLTGEGIRDRGIEGVRIIKESGPNPVRRDSGDYDDFVDCYYVTPPRLTNGDQVGYIASAGAVGFGINAWIALAEASFQIIITVNGIMNNSQVVCNFTECETWQDIAEEITKQMQAAFGQYAPECFCRYADQYFYFFPSPNGGDVITNTGAGTVGVDISGVAWLNIVPMGALQYFSSGHIIGQHGYTPNGGGNITYGLKPPTDNRQWTYFSMYGTKTVKVPGDESLTAILAGQQGVNIDQFVWLDDVPVAKAFTCEMVNGVVDATVGIFQRMDIGSRLKFQSGGEYEIRVYNSPTQIEVLYGPAIGWNEPLSSACIGEGRVITASQSGTRISRQSGGKFLASDIGKIIFWADGGYGHIREWINNNEVEVWETATRTNQGITLDPTRRCYNDTIIDDSIPGQIMSVESRFKALPLRNRFDIPLPNGCLGTFTNGFMFVGAKNGKMIYYSQAPIDYEYLVGHYFPEFQKHPVKDSLQGITERPDRVILYCSQSTYGILTTSFQYVEVPEVGELKAVIPGVSLLDPNTGIKDQSCIQKIDGGDHVVMTSKGGIKIFNGNQYSEDLALDNEGKSFIKKTIQGLQPVVAVGYNEVYGFMLWASDEDQINNTVVELNRCYKLGIKNEHSRGWAELGGLGWIIPEPGIGAFEVFNDKDQGFMIIMDARRGLPYLMATKDGPEGSGISKVWKDKVGLQYDAGYEIPWHVDFKEHRGQREDNLIRHLVSHAFLRPQFEDKKGKDNHTQWGYRTAQQVTLTGYQNGNVVHRVQAQDLPDRADITFDRQFEDNRIQFRLSGTASELRLTKFTTDYEQKDQRARPDSRYMREHIWQEELCEPLFWVCRGSERDLATNGMPAGSIFGFGIGPDGENSSMIFAATSNLTYTFSPILSEDFSILFAISGVTTGVEILSIGNFILRLELAGGVYTVSADDGANVYTQELEWNGNNWTFLKITRNEDKLIISENGKPLMSMLLNSIEVISGNLVFNAGNTKNLFNPWIFSSAISEEAFNYFYRNVTLEQGEALLCPV